MTVKEICPKWTIKYTYDFLRDEMKKFSRNNKDPLVKDGFISVTITENALLAENYKKKVPVTLSRPYLYYLFLSK